jgi:hypothetical protein
MAELTIFSRADHAIGSDEKTSPQKLRNEFSCDPLVPYRPGALVGRPLLIRPQTPILVQIGNGGGMLMREEITPQGRLGFIGKNHRFQKEPF